MFLHNEFILNLVLPPPGANRAIKESATHLSPGKGLRQEVTGTAAPGSMIKRAGAILGRESLLEGWLGCGWPGQSCGEGTCE